jgi:tyrosyl-tRNA synthetase
LAWEATKIAHGKHEAHKALKASAAMFGKRELSNKILPSSEIHQQNVSIGNEAIPSTHISFEEFKSGIPAFKLIHLCGMANSSSAARRLVQQGGAYLNGKRIESFDYLVSSNDIKEMEIVLRTGKKRFHKIIVKK